jgi:hypothetical protein
LPSDAVRPVVHAASTSDRRDAVNAPVALAADARRVVSIDLVGRIRVLTGVVRRARWMPWNRLPKRLGVIQSAGAFVIEDDGDVTHVFPVNEWWMDPAPAQAPAVITASGGFDELSRELGVELVLQDDGSDGVSWATARVHSPVDSARLRRARVSAAVALGVIVAVFLGGSVFLLLVGHRLFSIEDGPRVLGWSCAAASALGTINTVRVLAGRRRTHRGRAAATMSPFGGSPWFRRSAAIRRLADGQIETVDGTGTGARFDTTVSSAARSALVRARFVGQGGRGRVLLIDAVDVVRAELPRELWAPDESSARELADFLAAAGVLVESTDDRRRSAAASVDEFRNATAPGSSLFTGVTTLRVAPVLPLLAVAVVQLVVAVFARVGGIGSGALAASSLALSVLALGIVVGRELGQRLPRSAEPVQPRRTAKAVLTLAWTVSAIGIGVVVGITAGSWASVAYGLIVGLAVPCTEWVLYRGRSIAQRRPVVGIVRWLVSGAPR